MNRKRRKVPMIRLLAAALLGLATTGAVAWIAANIRHPYKPDQSGLAQSGRPTWHIRRWREWGYTTQNFSPVEATGGSYQRERHVPELVSYWSRTATPPPPGLLDADSMNYVWYTEVAVGWPFRALMGDWTNDGRNYGKPNGMAGPRRGVLKIHLNAGKTEWTFPFRPILPGLAADTLLFGLPWFLLLVTPGSVRRRRRSRAGRCVNCGYALGGLPLDAACPECGRPRN